MKIVTVYRGDKMVATITAIDESEMKTLVSEVLSIYLFSESEGLSIREE